jgi:hypothetical protein
MLHLQEAKGIDVILSWWKKDRTSIFGPEILRCVLLSPPIIGAAKIQLPHAHNPTVTYLLSKQCQVQLALTEPATLEGGASNQSRVMFVFPLPLLQYQQHRLKLGYNRSRKLFIIWLYL